MAIKSLTDWVFSSQSDVSSFGVVSWEIFSLAKVPYPGLQFDDWFIYRSQSGYRMEKQESMPKEIERPAFNQLEDAPFDACFKLLNILY